MAQRSIKTFYDQEGYLVVESLFTDADLADVRLRTDQIIADPSAAPAGVSVAREDDTLADANRSNRSPLRGTSFLVRFDPVFRAFACHPKLLELTRVLLGQRIKVFRDQMLLKPPGGQAKPLHQDQSYFRVHPPNALVTAWVALDEATAKNGCMQYVPGSHKYGVFDVVNDPNRPVHHIPQTDGIELPDPVACPVPAGSVIFHHGCTLHASEDNRTDSSRRAVILHYTTADARSEHEQMNTEVSLEID